MDRFVLNNPMKTIRLLLACAALATLSLLLPTAFAQGTAFTYQGVLSQSGAAVNGSNDLTFTLYDAASGGNVIGPSNVVNDRVMTNGLFTVTLDFGASVFNGSARWLQIAVRPGASTGAYTNLTPRQAITATPYAVTASNLSGTLPATQLTGTLPNAQLSASVSLLGTSIDSTEITDGSITNERSQYDAFERHVLETRREHGRESDEWSFPRHDGPAAAGVQGEQSARAAHPGVSLVAESHRRERGEHDDPALRWLGHWRRRGQRHR
jgi:hypothetical protein